MSNVAIIVPVFNQVEFTKIFLDSVLENTNRALIDVIFVDNGSSDGTAELLLSHPLAVDFVIRNEENLGVAAAWNQGLQEAYARGNKYACVCNNDIRVYPGWLDEMVKTAVKYDLMAVIPRSTSGEDDADAFFAKEIVGRFEQEPDMVPALLFGWCFLLSFKWLEMMRSDEQGRGEYDWNPTPIALFDEVNFKFAHYEDTDMDNRIRAFTKAPSFSQKAFVHHFGSRTLTQNLGWLMPHIEANADRYHKKYNTDGNQ